MSGENKNFTTITQEAGIEVVDNFDEKRRLALAEIDNAKFGWFHIKTCIVAGVGFFTDAYDLFAINLVSSMLAYVYYGKSSLPSNIDLGLKVSAQVGTFVGQFLFGLLADLLGRKKVISNWNSAVLFFFFIFFNS